MSGNENKSKEEIKKELEEVAKKLPGKNVKKPRGGAKNFTRDYIDYDDLEDVD